MTLGNGGAYQKKMVDLDLTTVKDKDHPDRENDHPAPTKDIFWIEVDEKDEYGNPIKGPDSEGRRPGSEGYVTTYKKVKKYFKNKHFFIDPFQLTIAQWCYVHGY